MDSSGWISVSFPRVLRHVDEFPITAAKRVCNFVSAGTDRKETFIRRYKETESEREKRERERERISRRNFDYSHPVHVSLRERKRKMICVTNITIARLFSSFLISFHFPSTFFFFFFLVLNSNQVPSFVRTLTLNLLLKRVSLLLWTGFVEMTFHPLFFFSFSNEFLPLKLCV